VTKRLRSRSWRLQTLRTKATNLGFELGFLPKMFGPRHVQNRVFINGRRCQILAGLPIGRTELVESRSRTWPEFLIYVPDPETAEPVFIIPRTHQQQLSTDDMTQFANAWQLLHDKADQSRRGNAVDGDIVDHGCL
jgi:hypothetical protein